MIRKRAPRWQSAADRAQVAAELMEEAESLTATGVASPDEVKRSQLPPPLHVDLTQGAATLAQGADANAAIDPFLPAERETPPLPPLQAAQALMAQGDPDAALAVLDNALGAACDDAVLLLERSAVHSASGRFGAARQDLERVLRADPAHMEAIMSLALLLSRRGLWIEAVPRLKRAVELQPGYAAAWSQLGESLNRLDQLKEACAAYERAIELEPRNARALYGLGIVLDRLKRPDDATQMYRRSREAAGR